MRGSRLRRSLDADEAGIIPAHAGLTPSTWRGTCSAGDHPRACGAHNAPFSCAVSIAGSSPRMRGSRVLYHSPIHRRGIIPAHAGLTKSVATASGRIRDHPRACGAHSINASATRAGAGSSPRMRGSHLCKPADLLSTGIIPAHAGLTLVLIPPAAHILDHPRACGAHQQAQERIAGNKGSSPRMRGSLTFVNTFLLIKGIIPAHAGLTCEFNPLTILDRDHPRACGAHHPQKSILSASVGSSPRMRGSH